jgi:dynein heavy chain
MCTDLDSLQQVWGLTKDWEQFWSVLKSMPFAALEPERLEDQTQQYSKRVSKVPKEAQAWAVHGSLKDHIASLLRMIPIVLDLKNNSFRERHWAQLTDLIGKPFKPSDDSISLQTMIEYGLEQYAEQIASISTSATKELSIEQGLHSIEMSWAGVDLDIVPYKRGSGYYKLRSVETIFELLEENQVNISSMKSSKYFIAFEAEVNHWEQILSNTMEVIEMLLQVQRHWIYLENIFVGAEDIRKQLPRESSSFDQVNELWKSILSRMFAVKNALQATREPGVLDTLTDMNGRLEKIQKSLDTYLETKRQSFPRFYFLSNEDLLEILGQSKDPNAIQPRLRKCFDNIHRLELSGGNGVAHRAQGMYSQETEYVPFKDSVVTEGPVESWLVEIESQMRATLKMVLLNCLATMKKVKRDKWVKDWPGQMIITASQIGWTADVTKALLDAEAGDKNALDLMKKKLTSNLKKLAEMVRGPLTSLEQKKLTALITIEVHSRDVIEKMIKADCCQLNSFDWLSQLRFYYEKDTDDSCVVRQNNAAIQYSYEYLGCSSRLVVTALTDRVYMTLTNALKYVSIHRYHSYDTNVVYIVEARLKVQLALGKPKLSKTLQRVNCITLGF